MIWWFLNHQELGYSWSSQLHFFNDPHAFQSTTKITSDYEFTAGSSNEIRGSLEIKLFTFTFHWKLWKIFKEVEVTELPFRFEVLHRREARPRGGELDLDCDLLRKAEVRVPVQGQSLHSWQFLPHEGLMEATDMLKACDTPSALPQWEPHSCLTWIPTFPDML